MHACQQLLRAPRSAIVNGDGLSVSADASPLESLPRTYDAMNDRGCTDVRQHARVLGVKDSDQVWAAPASALEDLTVLRQLKEADVSHWRPSWQATPSGEQEEDLVRTTTHVPLSVLEQFVTQEGAAVPKGHNTRSLEESEMNRSEAKGQRQGAHQSAWRILPQVAQQMGTQEHHNAESGTHQTLLTIDFSRLSPEKRNLILQRINQNQDNMQREIARLESLKQEVIIAGLCHPNVVHPSDLPDFTDVSLASEYRDIGVRSKVEDVGGMCPGVICGQSTCQTAQDCPVLHPISVLSDGLSLLHEYPSHIDNQLKQPGLENRIREESVYAPGKMHNESFQCIHLPSGQISDHRTQTEGLRVCHGGIQQKLWVQNGTVSPSAIEIQHHLSQEDSMKVADKLIRVMVDHTAIGRSANGAAGVQPATGTSWNYQLTVMRRMKQAFERLDASTQDSIRSTLSVLAGGSPSEKSELTMSDSNLRGKPSPGHLKSSVHKQVLSSTPSYSQVISTAHLGKASDGIPIIPKDANQVGGSVQNECQDVTHQIQVSLSPAFECNQEQVPGCISRALAYNIGDQTKQGG